MFRLSRWMLILTVALLAYCLVLLAILAIALVPLANRGPVIGVAASVVVALLSKARR